MARLQDFQTVTPTSSDKLLVVQSQGQGLVPYGSKLDSANPTGIGALSINRKANTTVGSYSVAEGYNGTASGFASFSIGENTVASGEASFAIGRDTTASGIYSYAEGRGGQASGESAHVENNSCEASGVNTHAEGTGTKANHLNQHVFGSYNLADTSSAQATSRGNYIEIVGNGTADNNRSNARTLDWSGNEVLAGDLTINGSTSVGNILQYIGHTTFNSSSPAVIPKLAIGYGVYIVFGAFAGVSSKTLQIIISNSSIGSILDMPSGSAWSSSLYTLSYSSSTGLKIETSVNDASIISYIKSA